MVKLSGKKSLRNRKKFLRKNKSKRIRRKRMIKKRKSRRLIKYGGAASVQTNEELTKILINTQTNKEGVDKAIGDLKSQPIEVRLKVLKELKTKAPIVFTNVLGVLIDNDLLLSLKAHDEQVEEKSDEVILTIETLKDIIKKKMKDILEVGEQVEQVIKKTTTYNTFEDQNQLREYTDFDSEKINEIIRNLYLPKNGLLKILRFFTIAEMTKKQFYFEITIPSKVGGAPAAKKFTPRLQPNFRNLSKASNTSVINPYSTEFLNVVIETLKQTIKGYNFQLGQETNTKNKGLVAALSNANKSLTYFKDLQLELNSKKQP